jgi:hypothetical protein
MFVLSFARDDVSEVGMSKKIEFLGDSKEVLRRFPTSRESGWDMHFISRKKEGKHHMPSR